MPIAVTGNALTIVSFLTSQLFCCFFAPLEAGIPQGITRAREFCEFCTTLPVPGTPMSSVRHSYPYPRTLYFRSVCRVRVTQKHTWGIIPGYYHTKNFCNFCRTLMPVPATSGSSVRRCHKDPEYGYGMFIPARNFRKFCTPVPQHTRQFWEVL